MNIVKSVSTKPLLTTARDSVIILIVTLVITLICAWLYYKWVSTEEPNWIALIAKTSAATITLAFVYEYAGVNNMLAESSMRYAKGTTLSKYTTRREAMLYKCMYKLLASGSGDKITIDANMKILSWLIKNTNARGKLADAASTGQKSVNNIVEKLVLQYPDDKIIIEKIGSENLNIIKNIDNLGDLMTENIAYYLLVNGLDKYVDNKSAEELGSKIHADCCSD
jgi:hypothetical protein